MANGLPGLLLITFSREFGFDGMEMRLDDTGNADGCQKVAGRVATARTNT
jgi:hypothetical protein